MKVDRPGLCLLLADSSNSVILFRELEYVVIGALCLGKDKVKSGVAHILESHPREQRARIDCIRTKAPTPEYLSVEDQRSWGKKEPSYDHCRL